MSINKYIRIVFFYIIEVNNYSTIHRSRNNDKNGAGGVALLIRNDLKFSECKLFEALNLEIVAINTRINEKEVCVVSYYNPPNSKLNEKVLEILKKEEVEYIIMGDLNAKSTLWGADKNNENGDILDNLILENDCLIVNNKDHTHESFNGKSKSILDYCIISIKLHDIFEDFSVLKEEDMTSDHLPFILKLKINKNNSSDNNYRRSRKQKSYNYNKANWDDFKRALPNNFDNNIENNVDIIEDFIRKSLINAADLTIPTYSNGYKKQKQLPEHILDLIKARKIARKLSKKDPNCSTSKKLYNKLTVIIREENKSTRDNEWKCFVDKLGTNPPSTKPFWNRINTIRGRKTKHSIPTLKVENKSYESDEQKAKLFSSMLQTTFSSTNENQFDDKFKREVEEKIKNFDFKTQTTQDKNTFELKELNIVIKNLSKKSASGEDKISNLMIQNTTQELRKIILHLINETVKQSKLPKNWKCS